MKPLVLSINQTCEVLGGTSRSSVYRHIRAGLLKQVKFGRRTYVTTESVEALSASGIPGA